MAMPKQQEGEDRDSVATALFAIILQRKAKEHPNLKEFLDKIGMSMAAYYNLEKGIGNPTFWTVERTARALGLSVWDMLGVDEKVMRSWLAGQNIDLDKLSQSVEARRQARLKFSADQFAITPPAAPEPKPAEPAPQAKTAAVEKPKAASKTKTRKAATRKKA
jgi:transcriptional regulator with XRE-family HTH domain